ncbi:hephaestin-like protein [Littorina saxatilis]|uniref:Uncharacterized protein n=1 Tax=Littorina saxatilis TaxID=31220 RepID=A0AAN9GJM1_9CAEN
MGPGPMDPPCITRVYTSSSRDRVRDAYSGLVGPILVCRRGALNDQLRQRQVDHEFFLMMSVTDENLSWYSDHNFQALTVDRSDEDFYNSNLMHSMNGYLYGNLPGLKMCLGDRVVWHVFSVGSERDLHTIYFHGQPLTQLDTHLSATYVLPGYFRTLLMKAENPGEWAAVCQTNDHYNAGAKALFSVSDCGLRRDYSIQFARGSQSRTFFLQAEEEMWDYAPSGMDKISGMNLSDPDHDGHIFTTAEGPYLGKVYKKVRYHQYTDQTFTTEIKRDASEEYLGILGPIIAAEAYDIITLVFRNQASRPYSVHAQGLFYKKNSEGTIYGAYRDGAVQPGETKIYEWSVPVDFAPAEGDSDCINQAYYSAVDPVRDTNSGLIGPLVICKPGILDKSGSRTDQTKPMVLLFEIIDEAQSWYVDDNIKLFGNNASKDDPDFGESCLMHTINGYIYSNNPVIEVPQYGLVDWHLMSLGNDVDIHSVHFHGNEIVMFETGKHTKDVTQLFPGIFETVRMNATLAGQWLLHCHVHDHLTAGMETTYLVTPPAAAPTVDPFGFIGSN